MFFVVVFRSDNSAECVPKSWLNAKKTKCAFPPNKISSLKIDMWVKNKYPADDSWPRYDIRILKACETFEIAKEKHMLAMETSDLDTDIAPALSDDDEPRYLEQKRKRTATPSPAKSDSSSIMASPMYSSTTIKRPRKLNFGKCVRFF